MYVNLVDNTISKNDEVQIFVRGVLYRDIVLWHEENSAQLSRDRVHYLGQDLLLDLDLLETSCEQTEYLVFSLA